MGKSEQDKQKIKEMTRKGMEQDRMKLLARQPFISLILMHLEMIPISSGCTTACTDGERIFMNCRFYAKLDQDERLFVLAHEAWHCVLLHQVRYQGRNPHKFNIAADLEIHFILMDEQMKEPFVLPHDPNWKGLSAEEIYEKLNKSKKPSKRTELGHDSKNIHSNPDGSGFDEHVFDGRLSPRSEENAGVLSDSRKESKSVLSSDDELQRQASSDTANDAEDDSDSGSPENLSPFNNESQEDSFPIDPDYEPRFSSEAVEKIRSIVIQTAQTIERRQGNLPGYIQWIVERLRKPELNWQELLRQFITSGYSCGGTRRWLPPARRYIGMGLYLQSRRSASFDAVMAIDTSGSTTNDLPVFFSELTSLLNSFGKYNLTVIQCDCEINHVESFSGDNPLPKNYKWKSYGHGGTSFIPPFEYVKDKKMKPDVFIYLTDGYGDAPKAPPPFPVLWILTSGGREPAIWGKTIKLKGDMYE